MVNTITLNSALELISHEAIVREAYKDSVGVWTWSVGLTNSSGHTVYKRYLDNEVTIEKCLSIFLWALDNKYIPAVNKAFKDHDLTEAEFAAALSFHYNTGGIGRATWARLWREGDMEGAYKTFLNWKSPPEIIPRRKAERELFFNGVWSNNGKATVYPVKKPSYKPDFNNGRLTEIRSILEDLIPS